MAGSTNEQYRHRLQNLLSRGALQRPKTMMEIGGLKEGNWPGLGSGGSGLGSGGSGLGSGSFGIMGPAPGRLSSGYMKPDTSQHGSIQPSRGYGHSEVSTQQTWRYCELCDLHFQTHRDFQIHTSGTMHAKKAFDSKTSNRGPAGRKSPEGYGRNHGNERSAPKKSESGLRYSFTCKICNIHTQREQDHAAHMEGKRHAEKYLGKITELGFKDFFDRFGDVPFTYNVDKRFIQANGDYLVPRNSWNMLDVPVQYRKQVTEYIVRCASVHNIQCKVCDNIVLNPSNWWSHVSGRKHTSKCVDVGNKMGWNSYLDMYGAIPLLDHDAVNAIKKGLPYRVQETTPDKRSDDRQPKQSGGSNQQRHDEPRYQPKPNSRQSGDRNSFQGVDQHLTTHGFINNHNRPDPLVFQQEQMRQLEMEKQRQALLERERQQEMVRIKMMEQARMREIEEESQRQRESRLREEQRLQEEAMRIEEERHRIENEKRKIEEERRRLEDEQRRREEDHLRQEEETRRREEELKRRHDEQIRDLALREEHARRRRDEERERERLEKEEERRQEMERERQNASRPRDPANMKVDEAVSMVSVLLKGLQQQQPEVLQAAGIRLQDKDSIGYSSQHQEFRARSGNNGQDWREPNRGYDRGRDRSRSPFHQRQAPSRKSRERIWVGGNDEEEFVSHDHPERFNDRSRSPPRERGGRDRGRKPSPRRKPSPFTSRRTPPPRPDRGGTGRPAPGPQSLMGEPPKNLLSMNLSPPLGRTDTRQMQMDRPRNAPRVAPQQSILGEPPRHALPMRPRGLMDQPMNQGRQGPSEEDYMLASQIQQMTGLQDIDDIAQAMSVMKAMDPEVLQLLGSLDPSVIQSLVTGGPAALNLQGPMMDQVNYLMNSGVIDSGALQLLMAVPGVFDQGFPGGELPPRRPQAPPPRPLLDQRTGSAPGGRGGARNKPPATSQGRKGNKPNYRKGNKRGK